MAIPKPIRSVPALPSAAACVLAERYWLSVADEPGIGLRADQISLLRDWDIEMWSNTIPVMLLWLEATLASGLRTALLSNMPDPMVAHVRLQFS